MWYELYSAQGKSAVDRAKLIPDSEITIDDSKITIDAAICNEAIIISNIFDLSEMDAVELVLSGEGQKMHFDCLNRGLIAVVCYYDVHRLLSVLLNCILGWDRECLQEPLRNFIEENFVQRPIFKHLLQLQSSFNVTNEFHMLMQPNINGLGGTKHQQLLRNVIDEIRETTAECLYALCLWGADQAREFLSDIYPILKGVPLAEKFSAHHLSAWIALIKLTSYQVLSQIEMAIWTFFIANAASLVLSDMVKEIRDETAWSDQSVCGTVQLACAIALRVMAVSPADHLSISVDVDIDRIVDRAIRNMAMQFIRHGIIERLCLTHVCVVDFLLKQLIAHFPAKLMEIERNAEDELCWIDDMVEKEQQVNPSLHYENLLRCISDLYYLHDDPKSSTNLKDCIRELSLAYSSSGSMELCRFMERARQSNHVVHAVAYLDMLRAVCRTQATASFIFDVFARLSNTTDNSAGWDHVMAALRSYERLFRDQRPSSLQFGHLLTVPQQAQAVIPPRELAGLVAWINLARTVAELPVIQDDEAAELFLEERQWAVVDASIGVISSPVPLLLKGALLRLLGALAKKDVSALRIWNSLNVHQICSFAENGALLGLQQELDERECTAKQYDTSIGFVHLMKALLSHSTIPEFAAPYLQYLTKSIVSQLSSRSYSDVSQMWELAEVSLTALLNLINQSHTDAHAVVRREPHISLLVQILNDTPLFRVVCGILLEDCDSYQDPCTGGNRPSEKAVLSAIRLLSSSCGFASFCSTYGSSCYRFRCYPCISTVVTAKPTSTYWSQCLGSYIPIFGASHSLPAALLLRELCSVRPSLQNKMVDLLRSRRLVNSNVRAVRSVLNSAYLRYSVADIIERDINDSDVGRMRGETARVVLEILSG
uniref:Mediator of RNA polymerase II transcription subunit 5 n=1 Tax=Heterorhabditis bacteriophora TaxID=37862 RepID=A0A1I7XTQ6_HETBA